MKNLITGLAMGMVVGTVLMVYNKKASNFAKEAVDFVEEAAKDIKKRAKEAKKTIKKVTKNMMSDDKTSKDNKMGH